jgi:hypothetical protein
MELRPVCVSQDRIRINLNLLPHILSSYTFPQPTPDKMKYVPSKKELKAQVTTVKA